ncbi:MAG TPA: MBL fold metallo-hydrolase [Gemmatimonadaceae bacterium]|jgi:glyoxylase-like metal-dependent hydrolase (beta-lactamase superfamily II)
MKRIIGALCVGMFAAVAAHAQVATGDPVKRGLSEKDFPRAKQLEPGVYSYEALRAGDAGRKMTTVSLIVVTTDGVVVVDGQGNVDQTKEMVDWIKKTTPQPIKYVVIGSDHGDHTGGNAAFPESVKYYVSPASARILAQSNHLPANNDTVPHKKVLHVGNTEVDILFLGRAHTGGDLSVYLPKERVLFMSEAYLHWIFPAMRSAYPSEWVQTVKNAETIDAKWFIAGHGFVDDAATMKKDLPAYLHAMEQVIAEATRLHDAGVPCPAPAGRSAAGAPRQMCEAALKGNWGDLKNWTLYDSQLEIAIRRVYDELDGKLSP